MPILIFNFSRAFPLLHFLHSSSTYQSSFPSHFLTASSDSSPLIVESHGSGALSRLILSADSLRMAINEFRASKVIRRAHRCCWET
ncbi:uncharacterized protein LOC129295386 isoform X3 [Prosopis cineraria]|uniref:uncharacterized protein LOC129295386 isoform X3 n=1 Tax=Prosopis cineraria TaxID=364024 RepID=UPI00240EDEC3|nr:uncharacterized protein LOC129295386 isoform X3 [Prosopis cineraria]